MLVRVSFTIDADWRLRYAIGHYFNPREHKPASIEQIKRYFSDPSDIHDVTQEVVGPWMKYCGDHGIHSRTGKPTCFRR